MGGFLELNITARQIRDNVELKSKGAGIHANVDGAGVQAPSKSQQVSGPAAYDISVKAQGGEMPNTSFSSESLEELDQHIRSMAK